jgi:DnaK suppressor protein
VAEAKKQTKEQGLESVRQQLLKRKNELEQELKQLHQEKFSDDQVQDAGDQALSSTMDSLKSSLQTTKIDEYKRLVLALEMIEAGTYGICVDCQAPISEKRLTLFPNATRCLACQELYEESGSSEKFE